tara:strand:- start:3354 stop:3605 length:252 start_codon:yes stop_codon:yes gene_type:complete
MEIYCDNCNMKFIYKKGSVDEFILGTYNDTGLWFTYAGKGMFPKWKEFCQRAGYVFIDDIWKGKYSSSETTYQKVIPPKRVLK